MLDMNDLNLRDLRRGYRYDAADDSYCCIFCEARYTRGIIFPIGERLADARWACESHIVQEHGSAFEALIALGKKATGLTDVQGDLMRRLYRQTPDKEISRSMNIAASTVRYQRHALREKARQAKVFLALSELMEESLKAHKADDLIEVHPGATMVDDRYLITESEAEAVLRTYFSSMNPLKLNAFPPKQKKKIVILREIADRFDRETRYAGREVDDILGAIFEDYATLRRYLIEYGFMERTADGKTYWRT